MKNSTLFPSRRLNFNSYGAFARSWVFALVLVAGASSAYAERVEYDLTIARQTVNFTGKDRPAMTLNGNIPGPTLRFTEGDTAVIRVHNKMDVETSIHWHGLILPNEMDGVPYVTYPPIAAGTTFTYEFELNQSGTYWYHSHTMLQEQRGLYGSFIIEPREPGEFDDLRDHVILLSDWTDEDADSVLHTLKRGSEWYAIQKNTGQSILGAARSGRLGDYFSRELQRMPPMDLSDVYYERFLLNGASEQTLAAKPGEKIRLRVIDGSATTFFYLQWAGGPMQVISSDGLPIQPFDEQRLLMGVAETYDVVVTVPESGAYEFRTTAHDGSGHASLWIGEGTRHPAPDIPAPDLYAGMGGLSWKRVFALTPGGSMGMPGREVRQGRFDQPGMNGMSEMEGMSDMEGMDHGMNDMSGHSMSMAKEKPKGTWFGLLVDDISSKPNLAVDGMSPERPWPPYDKLRALEPTTFASDKPLREVRLTLDGDMERYVWFLNNKPLSETDHILVKEGEVVRFIMINRSMMHHPMHLHGHFFRVINAQGDYSPLKHTVDVAPMTTTVIEFDATEKGDWFFHCHLLYHMMSGMARVVHYQDFSMNPATAAVRPQLYEDPYYLFGQVDAMSNMAQGVLITANTRHIFSAEWQAGWKSVDAVEWEVIPTYDYYLNRFTSFFGGMNLEGVDSELESNEGVFGVRYLLPLNIETRSWVDTAGAFRFAFGKDLELTPRLVVFSEAEYDTKEQWEIRAGASYQLAKDFSLIGQWHTDFRWGGGLRWMF
jgi:CopA family copper-resistance protein